MPKAKTAKPLKNQTTDAAITSALEFAPRKRLASNRNNATALPMTMMKLQSVFKVRSDRLANGPSIMILVTAPAVTSRSRNPMPGVGHKSTMTAHATATRVTRETNPSQLAAQSGGLHFV